jgi:hypothetical protein
LEIIWHGNCIVLNYSFIQSGSSMNTSLRSFAVKTTFAAVTALAFAASASATTLTTKLAVDNGFTAYLSTSNSSTGTQFSVGHDWPTVVTGTVELGTAAKYYLQVAAYDDEGSAGLLGEFSLAGTGYHFADGSTTVLTGPTCSAATSLASTVFTPPCGILVKTACNRGILWLVSMQPPNGSGPAPTTLKTLPS